MHLLKLLQEVLLFVAMLLQTFARFVAGSVLVRCKLAMLLHGGECFWTEGSFVAEGVMLLFVSSFRFRHFEMSLVPETRIRWSGSIRIRIMNI